MEDKQSTTSMISTDLAISSMSRYDGLIDIPLTDRIIDSLISLYNYFDIYAPKMPIVYNIVTFFRFFQLIGGSFMAANHNAFKPGTLTYDVMSIITVLFHIVPVEYRRGNGYIFLYVVNSILILFAIYLIFTAFSYISTSKVPKISTIVLSIFMAVGPFILLPVSAQYAAQMLSGNIRGTLEVSINSIIPIVYSVVTIAFWMWIIIRAYTKALVFRPCSFAAVEGTPQTKLLITTVAVTFASALTTNLPRYYSAGCMIVSFLLYIYSATTVFRCGTFIKTFHQVMVLSGCFIGMILCGANLYPIFTRNSWNPAFFAIFLCIALIIFILVYLFIRNRQHRELRLLDEIDDTNDITVISIPKFKQMLSTGFSHSHPLCLSFRYFKLAVAEWKDAVDIWALYAKFVAIYPEQSSQLGLIVQFVSQLKTKNTILKGVILSSTGYILKTRETKLTQQLKNKLSKLNKIFNKTKARLRNVWDLILQGNINEMNSSIKRAKDSVDECEVEMSHLLMQYPNNRFVARQNVHFLNEIKCDQIAAKGAVEKLLKLQRGLNVASDTIHDLGLAAFPNLPEYCISASDSFTGDKILQESESVGQDDTLVDDTVNVESIETISKRIDKHKVPGIQFMIWSTLICFLVLFLIPLVVASIYFFVFKKELERPVSIITGIAHTRNTLSILTGYVGRFLFTQLEDPYNPGTKIQDPLPLLPGFTLSAFGGYRDARDVLRYYANQVSVANYEMSKLRGFKRGNKYLDAIRKKLFSNSVNFSYFLDNNNSIKSLTSVAEISYMVAMHVGKLCDLKYFDAEVVKGPDSLTARNNMQLSLLQMNDALDIMSDYLQDMDKTNQLFFKIAMFIGIALCLLIYFSIYLSQCRKLRQNRQEILYILTTLPKTVISNVSASFNKIKGSEEKESDSEGSRQEDSIIKLFSSISDGSAKASIEMINMFLFILLAICGCASYVLVMTGYMKTSQEVVHNSHHINYLFGTSTYLYSVLASIFKIALATYHPMFKDSVVNLTEEIENVKERIPMLVDYFQSIRFGGRNSGEKPFEEMKAAVNYATEAIKCKDPDAPPVKVLDSIHCFSAAQQLYITTAIMNRYLGFMILEEPIYPVASDKSLEQLWQIGPIELYETFFYKTGYELVPVIVENVENQGVQIVIYTIVFIILAAILSGCVIGTAMNENVLLKYTLKLFLRCPSITILSNQRVMNLISGNYNFRHDDLTDKHTTFSNEVIQRLDDVVIVSEEETGKIITVNTAFTNMFGISQSEAEDMTTKDLFTEERFKTDDNLEKIFNSLINVVYTKDNGENVYIEFSSACVSGRRIFFGTNQTQNILHEKLIQDEKKKSDAMLASILPASLVPRVQAGEKNISFSVQSVTVLFLDVVEFTPWCGSHDAHYVMRMLNIMFKEFDAITNAHKTMTKIKCIGDCYMAAGGIFDEINQPAVHAKEVVDFGCCVIKKLLEIDENENETLRIRVGINTGGPIVAGVIGTEKPTFEILGPAINIAHEMEHHGVAMKVHISRPVYELIYGQQFDIKERGEIDVKGGKMFTYLVEP